ncbi:MAG: 3-phosphoshikimate 1-carboxyvinyltransferase, partial [Planctomycetota bacterium]
MEFRIRPGAISGSVTIPGSKSHTIRGLIFGLLASGQSHLRRPLDSSDTASCVHACPRLGAGVDTD